MFSYPQEKLNSDKKHWFCFLSSPRQKIRRSPRGFLPRPLLRADKIQKQISLGFAKSFSPENSFRKTESALKPHALPEYLEGRTPKKNVLSISKKNFTPAKSRKQETFFFGVAGVLASAWGFGSFVQFPLEKSSRKVYNYSTSSNLFGIKNMERFCGSQNRALIFAKTLSAYGGSREIP